MKIHDREMDFETTVLLRVIRSIPPFPKAHTLAKLLLRRYNRRRRDPFEVDVLGYAMRLDPHDFIERAILFYPHLFDTREIQLMREHLSPGDTFLDVGANIGFYSFMASSRIGDMGKVIAFEADPSICETMRRNIDRNGIRNIDVVNVGVSDRTQRLSLARNTSGNRGANSFMPPRRFDQNIEVECRSLLDLLLERSIRSVSGAKLDIEGFERRVLQRFFEDADRSLYPRFLQIENNRKYYRSEGAGAVELVKAYGYTVKWQSKINVFLTLRDGK